MILLHASRADQVRTIVPVPLQPVRPKTLSEKVITTLLAGVQLSEAVAFPVTCTEVLCSQDIVNEGGTVNAGAVLS